MTYVWSWFSSDEYLIEVVQDDELPDTGLKPHDVAVLLAHFVAREETEADLLRVDEGHAAQNGDRGWARRQFPSTKPSLDHP